MQQHYWMPIWLRSESNLEPNLSIIGNVSKSTNILILNGENDSQTPVQQAFLLQQRLTEVNHPDHTLITYQNLGHVFYPSYEWQILFGPIQPYVLGDLYSSASSSFRVYPSSQFYAPPLFYLTLLLPNREEKRR